MQDNAKTEELIALYHLGLYLGGCIVYACYRTIGGKYVTVPTWNHAGVVILDLVINSK